VVNGAGKGGGGSGGLGGGGGDSDEDSGYVMVPKVDTAEARAAASAAAAVAAGPAHYFPLQLKPFCPDFIPLQMLGDTSSDAWIHLFRCFETLTVNLAWEPV